MKTIFYFILLILFSFMTYSFDCSYFNDQSDCLALLNSNESHIANLIYQNSFYPDHNLIKNYNKIIVVNEPLKGTEKISDGYIKDAWFNLLTIEPSILFNNTIYYNSSFKLRTAYDYDVYIPPDYVNNNKRVGRTCRIFYYFDSKREKYSLFLNNQLYTHDENKVITSRDDILNINPELEITVVLRKRIYEWRIRDDRWRCYYDRTTYSATILTLQDYKKVKLYDYPKEPFFEFLYNYNNMDYGNLSKYNGNLILDFDDSSLVRKNIQFEAEFINSPYYFLQLKAVNKKEQEMNNIYKYNDLLAIPNKNGCLLKYSDFFNIKTKQCEDNYQELELNEFEMKEYSSDWKLLLYLIVFIAVNWGIFVLIKKYFYKITI